MGVTQKRAEKKKLKGLPPLQENQIYWHRRRTSEIIG
jgi:hypothetical protein